MKCIYCEEGETKGVLLCYGCQVDLFPLVSAWAYCGVCGSDLPANSAVCPQCAQTSGLPAPVTSPAVLQSASPLASASPEKNFSASAVLEPATKKAPVRSEEINQARRFQWIIKSIFAVFWLTLLILVLLWARDYVNQPMEPFVR